jgi:hypothetical protein
MDLLNLGTNAFLSSCAARRSSVCFRIGLWGFRESDGPKCCEDARLCRFHEHSTHGRKFSQDPTRCMKLLLLFKKNM